jgi:nucleoid DNA-binding protein
MTRREITDLISKQIDMPKKYIDEILVLFLKTVKDNLLEEETIYLRGFGTFGTKERKESIRRNPRTNEKIHIPKHNIVYFKPGKDLKELKKVYINPDNNGKHKNKEVIGIED